MLHDYWLDVLDITCSFFFKQKTAYELRISYWSSDVCSSDLVVASPAPSSSSSLSRNQSAAAGTSSRVNSPTSSARSAPWRNKPMSARRPDNKPRDRKSVVKGKSVSVSVELGGGRIIKKKKNNMIQKTHKHTSNKEEKN